MKNDIDYKEYKKNYCKRVDLMTEKELIEAVEFLKGKSSSDEYEEIEDCAVDLVSNLLKMDWGRSIVIEYTKAQKMFFKSEYLSTYFKESIKEMLEDSISQELEILLNSDKNIGDMSSEEIKMIKREIDEYYKINGKSKKWNISSRFMSYIYKLNSKGSIEYIKNNTYPSELAREILYTSGLNARSSYYSGRGVNYGDLNDKHLAEIYKKLLILDENYAKSFVWLVDNMKTLGATEFIDSFINLGYANFDHTKFDVRSDRNISLDGLEGNALLAVGMIALCETGRRSKYHYGRSTEMMKMSFHGKIDRIHEKVKKGLPITEEEIEMMSQADTYFYEDWMVEDLHSKTL